MKRILMIMTAMALAAGAAAQGHSVLASGQWWKLTTTDDGVYRLTTFEVPALLGASVDSLAVYGQGAGMLSVENSKTPTDDLTQLAIEVRDRNGNGRFDADDELLFYGEGPERWRYDEAYGRWLFEHHAYATENAYYLTLSCATPRRLTRAAAVEADTVYTTHRVVAHVDNDLVSPFRSGQLWMGEKFSTALSTRSFELRLPGTGIGDLRLRYGLASTGTTRATFTLATQGLNRQESLGSGSPYVTGTAALALTSPTVSFSLHYEPVESAGSGYLDFLELNALATLTFSAPQMVVRNDRLGRTARFTMGNAQGVRVWEVSRPGSEREMALTDGSWSDSTTACRRYIAFDGTSYLAPLRVAALANQDLHGAAAADLVVVAHPLFLEQAQRLASLHELFDGLSTLVVTDAQVYNEFSSGKQDPMAIRALLRMLRSRYPDRSPRYLILFGKGSFDNRHLLGSELPTVVTYETPESFDDDGRSYASDDMLGYLSPTGRGTSSETLHVSVGRLPAKSVEEAEHIVDKLEGYITRRDLQDEGHRGDWRNYVALLADDADPAHPGDSVFAHSSEAVATAIRDAYPQLNLDRLYADAYHQESGAIGSYYPDLNNALHQRINYGCLLLNYIGHGSTTYIGTERYIELSNIAGYTNTDRLPLFVTSTCSYGHYDQPDEECGAEACLLAPAGMIGVISASRPISHMERFNKDVVLFALDPANTIGDALRLAKSRTAVPLCINLIGDPAVRLSQPDYRVRVTHINGQAVDDSTTVSASVLSRVTVSGVIVDSTGAVDTAFDGTLFPVVYDREVHTTTLANDNPGTEVAFAQQKTVLYKGSHEVRGGRFEYSFIVPQDVSYRYDYCKLSHYAKSATADATGSYGRLQLGGTPDSLPDSPSAPAVALYMGSTHFRPGGITGPSPTLLALLSDSVGINVGTGLGHDITAVVDDNPNSLIVLNDLYQSDIDDSRCGSVAYTLQGLAPGRHTVTVKAWNIYGVSGSATVDFVVHSSDTLTFSELTCAPNPAVSYAEFTLRVNTPASIAKAELQLYNMRGQLIASFLPAVSAEGFLVGPVRWDVSSVPPGLYLARMVIVDADGETHQKTAKCMVR